MTQEFRKKPKKFAENSIFDIWSFVFYTINLIVVLGAFFVYVRDFSETPKAQTSSEIQRAALEHIEQDHKYALAITGAVLLFMMVTIHRLTNTNRKLRNQSRYSKILGHIHSFHHDVRDAEHILDKQNIPDEQAFSEARTKIINALGSLCNIYSTITESDCRACLRIINNSNGKITINKYARDSFSNKSRKSIDAWLREHSFNTLEHHTHLRELCESNNGVWSKRFGTQEQFLSSDYRMMGMHAFNELNIPNPIQSIVYSAVAIADPEFADFALTDHGSKPGGTVVLAILYVDSSKKEAFNADDELLLSGIADSMFKYCERLIQRVAR